MNISPLTSLIALVTLVCALGCGTARHKPSPLDGWHIRKPSFALPGDKMIVDDYNAYIQNLPPGEKRYVDENSIWFLEDSSGQTAVEIKIPLDGTWWVHALIYDKDKTRIKAVKYRAGRYRS